MNLSPLELLLALKEENNIYGSCPIIAVCGWNYELNVEISKRLVIYLEDHIGVDTINIAGLWRYPFTELGRIHNCAKYNDLTKPLAYWTEALHVAAICMDYLENDSYTSYKILPNAPNPSFHIAYKTAYTFPEGIKSSLTMEELISDSIKSGIILGRIEPLVYENWLFNYGVLPTLAPMLTVVVDTSIQKDNDYIWNYNVEHAAQWRQYVAKAYDNRLYTELVNLPKHEQHPLNIKTDNSLLYFNYSSTNSIEDLSNEILRRLPKLTGLMLDRMSKIVRAGEELASEIPMIKQ